MNPNIKLELDYRITNYLKELDLNQGYIVLIITYNKFEQFVT